MSRSPAAVARLQACLALEHEAIWLYSYVGARFTAIGATARKSYDRHRRLRDQLLALLRESRATNPLPAADYAVDNVTNVTRAKAVLRSLESRSAAAWLSVIGVTEGSDRQLALGHLRTAALAELDWDGKPEPFPGLAS